MKNSEIINLLSEMVTENRLETFYKVLNQRTRYITVVLEDIFQSHNASAVLRSCDCFGVQDVHVIENYNRFSENRDIVLGASQWLNIYKYNKLEQNTLDAIKSLKKNDYRIVATTPHTGDVSLDNLDLTKGKIALMFGSELPGLSEIALNNADEFVKIPMHGFTESFNISVSAAICMYDLYNRLVNSNIDYLLSKPEKDELLAKWLKISVKDSGNIIKVFKQRLNCS